MKMQFLFYVSIIFYSIAFLIFVIRNVHCQQFPNSPATSTTPANLNNNKIEYTLYTRSHINQSLPINHTHLGDMVSKAPLVVLVHGWREHLEIGTGYMDMKNAYLGIKDQNVIGMDWGQADDNIAVAIASIGNLGTDLTLLLLQIRQIKKIRYSDMHIIGHSLGGQIAGVAGRQILKNTGFSLGRITGLDPARPFFEYLQTGDNLNKKDAVMVDIVHTDAGVFGYHNAQGTVDFFPNGGIRDQPGCKTSIWQWAYIYMREMHKIFDEIACSHGKSKEYFLQSIYYPKIKALNCESWTDFKKGICKGSMITFGEYIPMDAQGQYFFEIDVTKKS